ncbi:MAG: GH3 auxin-responsive promoter family protein [Bacteroidales bacterium]|nr:GH3 auxin-responsive promoter family protein [Bacteroidales bacterium]
MLIKRILEINGTKNLKEVWPNLEVFFHDQVAEPYITQYKKYIPEGSIKYMETYNASEGFFAIQDQVTSNEMLLMLDYGIYYEFLPTEQLHSENPKTLTLDEVEKGKNYALVITTNAGLWRYLIGDTIDCHLAEPLPDKNYRHTQRFYQCRG